MNERTDASNQQTLTIQQAIDLGVEHHNAGNLPKAESIYQQILLAEPKQHVALNLLGVIAHQVGKNDISVDLIGKALSIKPDYAEAHYNLGLALQELGKLNEAVESYKKALAIKPDYAEAHNNLGNAFKDQCKLDDAVASYHKVLAIKPDLAEAHNNLGNAFKYQGKLDDAVASYHKALAIKPDFADVHNNLGHAYLAGGELEKGLNELEWRWLNSDKSPEKRVFQQPMWDGISNLREKTILIWGEQGPGDMLIWSSCFQHLIPRAKQIILECPPKLVPLFARSFPGIKVVPENRDLDLRPNDIDFHLPMGSLFRHFIPEISKETNVSSFLVPDPVRVDYWINRLKLLGQGPFVGISWKSPLMNPLRQPNYTQISDWSPVFSNSHTTFINLQSIDFTNDLAQIQDKFGITVHNFDDLDHFDNLDDVAALSAALDVSISVSTAVAAITAGVGTPTKFIAWRQSSWNNILFAPRGPSVEVFERNTWEPWDEVFKSIAKDILGYKVAIFR